MQKFLHNLCYIHLNRKYLAAYLNVWRLSLVDYEPRQEVELIARRE